jgi:hypothetical protein
MYDLITGPFLWASIFLFVAGSIVKIYKTMILVKNPLLQKSEIDLNVSLRHFRSGFGGRKPFFFFISFLFHVILIVAPLLQLAHGFI